MRLTFEKFHGAGNDFVMLDDRAGDYQNITAAQIQLLCDRHMGIGADGLILIRLNADSDFTMVYYNADGQPSSMCGNGGRCAVAFAYKLGMVDQHTQFMAVDGLHHASYRTDGQVRLAMQDVAGLDRMGEAVVTNTGSPHYVLVKTEIDRLDMYREGSSIRYLPSFKQEGINVNFMEQIASDRFKIRTYERGVENETLACGTGAVAGALAMHFLGHTTHNKIAIQALGGLLSIDFKKTASGYTDIYLSGPTQYVFSGSIVLL